MKFKIFFRPEAENDIENASKWYEEQRDKLGIEFLNEVEKTYKKIVNNPKIYPIIHKSLHRAIINRFPFSIFYKVEKQSIVIIAVMHGSRHPKRWQSRT